MPTETNEERYPCWKLGRSATLVRNTLAHPTTGQLVTRVEGCKDRGECGIVEWWECTHEMLKRLPGHCP